MRIMIKIIHVLSVLFLLLLLILMELFDIKKDDFKIVLPPSPNIPYFINILQYPPTLIISICFSS